MVRCASRIEGPRQRRYARNRAHHGERVQHGEAVIPQREQSTPGKADVPRGKPLQVPKQQQ